MSRAFKVFLSLLLMSVAFQASAGSYSVSKYSAYTGYKNGRFLTLSLENGSAGICSIQYIVALARGAGRSTYILYADPKDFPQFADAVTETSTPAVADLAGTSISVRLTASRAGRRLYGHILETNDRVIVVPAKKHRGTP